MKSILGEEYLSELRQFLMYEAKSRIARYVIYPVIFGLANVLAFGTAPAGISPWGLFCSILGFVLLGLLFIVFLTCVIFTFVHPYDKVAQRNRQREIARQMASFKDECEKETALHIAQETGLLRTELMKEYQRKHEEEMLAARQHAADEQKRLEEIIVTKNRELETKEQAFQNAIKSNQILFDAVKERYESETGALKSEIEQLKHQVTQGQKDALSREEEMTRLHNQEMESLRQRTKDEILNEDQKRFADVLAFYAKNNEKLMEGLKHRMVVVGQYVAFELLQFNFTPLDIATVQLLFKDYVGTSGGYDSQLKSPLVNRHKEEGGRRLGRKAKVSTAEVLLTTQDLSHLIWNVANYLDYRVEDVAKFVKHIFANWCQDCEAYSLAKSAKKDPEKGNIVIHADLERYVSEKSGEII